MKIRATLAVICLSYFSAPLMAQMRIGGGTRSSSSLRGVYSLTLTGRDVNALLAFAKVLDGIGAATFDGQSKVTFSLTNNTNQASGTAAIGSGDTASFSLQSFNGGKNYIVTGRDGAFVYIQISNI
jgi:hypothetical protein